MGKISVNQGDVILVSFPFFDSVQSKVRPALVLSGSHFNKNSSEIIACAITSKKPFDTYFIQIQDISTRKLELQSYIRPQNITKIQKSHILKSIGFVSEDIILQVKKTLFLLLKK